MRIGLRVAVKARRGGYAATAPDLGLSGHGDDEEEAIQSLERAALAWCFALHRLKRLDRALGRRGILWEPLDSGIELNLLVESPHEQAAP
jgi:hypothetical protein